MDRRSRRLVFRGVILAVLIGAVGSCWMVMHMAYKYGGINLDYWRFRGGPETIFNNAARNIDLAGVDWSGMTFLAVGALVMVLLTWARLQEFCVRAGRRGCKNIGLKNCVTK
jgi:hypothetical protein